MSAKNYITKVTHGIKKNYLYNKLVHDNNLHLMLPYMTLYREMAKFYAEKIYKSLFMFFFVISFLKSGNTSQKKNHPWFILRIH